MKIRLTTAAVVAVSALVGAQQRPLKSGIIVANMDTSVRPQDDFFRYVNGTWLAKTEIPADHTSIGSFVDLTDQAARNVRTIVEDAAKSQAREPGSATQQIGGLYSSFMDEARIAQLGATPLKGELDKIDAITTPADLVARIGALGQVNVAGPGLGMAPDVKQPGIVAVTLTQGGVTLLPDRDYYLKDDPKMADARAKYLAYLQAVFTLAGRPNGAADAQAVLALETDLAKVQWTPVESRDAVKSYNKFTIAALGQDMPGFDWAAWIKARGADRATAVIVRQPSFFKGFATLASSTPLSTWRAWLAAHLISAEAEYLSPPFENAHFELFDRILRGQQTPRPRWERGVLLVNASLGEAVGRLYVDQYFPPDAKARMERMVANILEAYRQAISGVDWMTPATRTAALDKLAKFMPQIGYPDTWRSYQGLVIKPDDLVGNFLRLRTFEAAYQMAKFGKPVNRAEWTMTPQTVNAYYAPPLNKIVFPAAILQSPFFQFDADDAVNYGAIGTVIGHEIGHGFDDQGRQYDGTGELRDWWLPADDAQFRKRAKMLADEYNAFSPIPGLHVNGDLTLGENLGDLGGLSIAVRAYRISLGGKPAPVIDGFTGEQRLFIGFGQIWRAKMRDEQMRIQLLSNPHSPGEYRTNGPIPNVDAFYEAFSVKPGDKMYRAPDNRVRIW
jgi:putative endopeptidase